MTKRKLRRAITAVTVTLTMMVGSASCFANSINIFDADDTTASGLLGNIDSNTGTTDTFVGFLGVNDSSTPPTQLPDCPAAGCSTSTSLAYAIDGTPADPLAWELARLNELLGTSEPTVTTAVQGVDWVTETTGSLAGYLKFTIDTEFFSLKIGNLAAYFQNTTGVPLILWYSPESGAGAGLSHYTEYGPLLPGGSNPTPVPLPAGVILLLTGLAGLGAARRISKKSV